MQARKIIQFIRAATLLIVTVFYSLLSIAGTPILTITPLNNPPLPPYIIIGHNILVSYTVTNTSPITATDIYVENLPTGVSQVGGDNACMSSTVLPVGGSCTLNLLVNSTAIGENNSIDFKLILCIRSLEYCSEPSIDNQLSTQVLPQPTPNMPKLQVSPASALLLPGSTTSFTIKNTSPGQSAYAIEASIPTQLQPIITVNNTCQMIKPQQTCTLQLTPTSKASPVSTPVSIGIAGANTQQDANIQITIGSVGVSVKVSDDPADQHMQYTKLILTNDPHTPATYIKSQFWGDTTNLLYACGTNDEQCDSSYQSTCSIGQVLPPSGSCYIWYKALDNQELGRLPGYITVHTDKNDSTFNVNYQMSIFAAGVYKPFQTGVLLSWINWANWQLATLIGPNVSPQLNGGIRALVPYKGDLYLAGDFTQSSSTNNSKQYQYIARFNGSDLLYPSTGGSTDGVNDSVSALATLNNQLFLGGKFTKAGEYTANHLATWDGLNWKWLEGGVDSGQDPAKVNQLATDNQLLYVGGLFQRAGGNESVTANNIATWNGNQWTALGGGVNNEVRAVLTDNTGIYVGGLFTQVNNNKTAVPASYLALWNNGLWSVIGQGKNNGTDNAVYAINRYSDKIYVGGAFQNVNNKDGSKLSANYVAAWDPQVEAWSTLTDNTGVAGPAGPVHAILGFDNKIYVGGDFSQVANSKPSTGFAVWDGAQWNGLISWEIPSDVIIYDLIAMPAMSVSP